VTRPADFPPPFDWREFVAEPTDPPDERIDVGVLVVGAGPAGLSAAIRLGQLLEEQPDVRERLGDVPVAVVEKGRAPGAHLLSGAVINPRAFRELFPGLHTEEMPFRGAVVREGVYFLTPKRHLRVPAPPTMWNHNHYVASISEVGRWLAERAEEVGVTIVPETSARTLLVNGGRVVGVRTGDKGRGKDGEKLPNFEPGSDIRAKVTVLAEGTQGHLAGVASERFGLASRPQVYALGVKEVWEVPKPLNRVIHTMGWPLRAGRRFREFGGCFIYPLGEEKVAIGMVVGLDYTDATFSVHDALQELKTHPFVRGIHPLMYRHRPYTMRQYTGFGNPLDTTIAAACLVFGGVIERFPRIRFLMVHGGGFVPYQAGRWKHGWQVRPDPQAKVDTAVWQVRRLAPKDKQAFTITLSSTTTRDSE